MKLEKMLIKSLTKFVGEDISYRTLDKVTETLEKTYKSFYSKASKEELVQALETNHKRLRSLRDVDNFLREKVTLTAYKG